MAKTKQVVKADPVSDVDSEHEESAYFAAFDAQSEHEESSHFVASDAESEHEESSHFVASDAESEHEESSHFVAFDAQSEHEESSHFVASDAESEHEESSHSAVSDAESEHEENSQESNSASELDSGPEEEQVKKNKQKFTEAAKSAATKAQEVAPAISAKAQNELDAKKAQVEKETAQASQDRVAEEKRITAKVTPANIKIEKDFIAAKEKPRKYTKQEQEKMRLAKQRDVKGLKAQDTIIVQDTKAIDAVVLPAIEDKATKANAKRDQEVAAQSKAAEENAKIQKLKRRERMTPAERKREDCYISAIKHKRKISPEKEQKLRQEAQYDFRIYEEVLGKEAAKVGATKREAIGKKAQTQLDAKAAKDAKEQKEAAQHKLDQEAKRAQKERAAKNKEKSKSFVPTIASTATVVVKPKPTVGKKETVGSSKVIELASKFTKRGQEDTTKPAKDAGQAALGVSVKTMTTRYNAKIASAGQTTVAATVAGQPLPTRSIAEEVKRSRRASAKK